MNAIASEVSIARRPRSPREFSQAALRHVSAAAVLLLLVPEDWMLRIFPYFGQFVFAACIGLAVTVLACWRLIPRSCLLLMVGTLAWMSLVPNLHRVAGSTSVSVVDARLFMADILIVLCAFGGWLLASGDPGRARALLGTMSIAAAAWGVLAHWATSAGVLRSTLAGERIGSTSVYLAAGLACFLSPYAWRASRRWWLVFLPSGCAVTVGLGSQTRTLIVMATATLVVQVVVSPCVRRLGLQYRLAVALSLVLIAAPAASSLLAVVSELRGLIELESAGRIEEFEDFFGKMVWSDWVFGLGVGGGFWRFGRDNSGMPIEAVSDGLHIGVLTPVIKLGVVASAALLVLALGRWLGPRRRAAAEPFRGSSVEGPMSVLLVILAGFLSGMWSPLASFAVGAGLGMSQRSRRLGHADGPGYVRVRTSSHIGDTPYRAHG